jgi:outer membrane protein
MKIVQPRRARLTRRLAAATVLLLLCGGAAAADLLQAWQQALATDPTLRAADAALQAGREKAVQGRALLLPRVSLSAGASHVDDRSSNAGLPPALAPLVPEHGSGDTWQAGVHLRQPLYDLKAGAEKRQLQQQSALAEVQHAQARQDLMQRVSEAYFGLLLAEEHLRVVGAEKAAVGLQRERAQARFEVGRGKVTDVQEAQARYDHVLAREVSAQSTLSLRQARYRELTGQPAQGLAPLRAGFQPRPLADDLEAWQQRGDRQAANVQTRRGQLLIAAAEVDKHQRAARPTLELVAGYAARGQSGGLSALSGSEGSRSASVGVQFSVPLFAGGALDSRLRESLAQRTRAEEDVAAARRDTRLQVQDAFLAVQTGVARVAALLQSLRSARSALEATTLGRDLGTRTELDVLDAQQRLFSAELDLAQARSDYLLARVRLAAAAGELGEAELQALNAELAA